MQLRRLPSEVIVLVSGTLARLAAFGFARADPAFTSVRFDEKDYFALAGLVPDPLGGAYADAMSPGYVAFLRHLPFVHAHGAAAAAIANLVLGIATQVITYRIARRFSSERAALVATLGAALLAPTIFYELRPLPEALSAFCVIGSAALLFETIDDLADRRVELTSRSYSARGTACALLGGTLAAFATMVRGSNALLVVGGLLVLLLVGERGARTKRLASVLGFAAGVALTSLCSTGPMIATSGPLNFYIGNGEDADGRWRVPREVAATGDSARLLFAAAAQNTALREGESVGRFYVERSLRVMAQDPVRTLRRLAVKAGRMVGREEVADNRDFFHERRFNAFLRSPFAVDSSLLIGFGVPGLFLLLRHRSRDRGLIALCGCVLPIVTMVGFFVVGRYRVTWFPWLAVGAAYAFTILGQAWAARATRTILMVTASVLFVFSISLAHAPPAPTARNHYLRGYDLHVAGRPDLALEEYDRAYAMARATNDEGLAQEVAYNRAIARAAHH